MIMKKIRIVGILIVVGSTLISTTGCAKAAKRPTSSEFKTFSKYGFSSEYPKDFRISETGVLENEANDDSGVVQGQMANKGSELFQVSWIKTLQYSLEGGLAGGFAGLEGAKGMASLERDELVETTKTGHRMLYQYYIATSTEGSKAYGILGVFYCDKSQEAFVLMTINTDIITKEDVLEEFQNYLNSFVCH